MSGNRYFLDTNAIIYLLKNTDNSLLTLLNSSEWVGISIIAASAIHSNSIIITNDKRFNKIKELTIRTL